MKQDKKFLILLSFGGSLLVLFILIPIVLLFIAAGEGLGEAITSSEAWASILLSFQAGVLAATLSTLFAIPLSYIMARVEFKGKDILASVMDLPLVIPHTVVGISIILAFGSRSPVGSLLGFGLEDTFWGIVAAMAFVSSSFPVNFARESFESVDVRLEQVARTLGAGQLRTFFSISLPLGLKGILTGWIMALARAISEVGAIIIVAYHPVVGSVLVYEWYTTKGLYAAAGLSALLLLVSFVVLAGMRTFRRWKG